eukprot:TRINITY_DN661_c0_g1_i2.p1 TRINITY_DN661_c0_g1~~TRINITY_DN661_c0_g1_i2.p1  ORF type:complete len:250 (+),score=42.79 TRINITY_DN661_c0_g1_i2:146-895(+)
MVMLPSRPILLVHGAWYGGWAFRDVIKAFAKRGITNVYAPTLTGLGERSHLLTPAVNLHTHIQDVTRVIETNELEDVVLVGHSYAGMVTTAVDTLLRAKIRHHVYLDAYVPRPNQSAFGIRTAGNGEAVALDFDSLGLTVACPDPSHHGLSGNVLDWARRQMTPMPKQCWLTPLPDKLSAQSSDDNDKPGPLDRHYIRLQEFPAFYFDEYEHSLSNREGWTYSSYSLPHNYFMMDPDWLVDILVPLAQR